MSKSVAYCVLIVSVGVIIALSAASPIPLSDQNSFLKDFVNHEFLNVLGVILAITLASAGQLHLTLNQIEEKHEGNDPFSRTRAGIKTAAFWLIGLFIGAVLLVVMKPLLASEAWSQTIFNGLALMIVLWNALILITITQAIFRIRPIKDD